MSRSNTSRCRPAKAALVKVKHFKVSSGEGCPCQGQTLQGVARRRLPLSRSNTSRCRPAKAALVKVKHFKVSPGEQSTRAQSLRLPSKRRAFLHQHTERRAATTRQLAASTADHALTNHTHKLSLVHARALISLHARTRHTLTILTQTTRKLYASVTNEFIVSAQWKQLK